MDMVLRKWVGILAVMCAGVILTGCKTTQNTPPASMFSADGFKPLALNARRLEIIDNWQMPVTDPYVGHRARPLPSNVLAEWATHVLQPAGGSGELVFDIRKAAVKMEPLPMKAGLDGLFTDQQSQRVSAEIEANMTWLQPVGGSSARIQLQASHGVTVAESATAAQVLNAIHEAVQGALRRIDGEARKELARIDRIILP